MPQDDPKKAPRRLETQKESVFEGVADPISPICVKLKNVTFFNVFSPAATRQLSQTLPIGAGAELRARLGMPKAALKRAEVDPRRLKKQDRFQKKLFSSELPILLRTYGNR